MEDVNDPRLVLERIRTLTYSMTMASEDGQIIKKYRKQIKLKEE